MRTAVTFLIVLFATAALLPSTATAVVRLDIENPILSSWGQDQVVYFDVFLTDLDNTNERLQAFTVAINSVTFNSTGIRFLPPVLPPSEAHPYVFKDLPATPERGPYDVNSTANRIQAGGAIDDGEVDVTPTLNGLFRVPVFVPADAVPGVHVFSVDVDSTSLAGRNGEIAFIPGQPAVFVTPEPSAAALVLIPALAALRRPRRTHDTA